jgi:hypothetical protein
MPRKIQRTTEPGTRRLSRTLACAATLALPALLVAGCSSESSSSDSSGSAPAGKSPKPSAAPVKYKTLPDACKTLSKNTVKDLTPKSDNAGGKRIGTGEANDSGSCLWSGLNKFDYRQLTVSLKRFDSDTSRGPGDKLAGSYLAQQVADIKSDKDNKSPRESPVGGVGDQATSIDYEVKKNKKKSEDFREVRLVIRDANAVVTVDYAGAGFEDGKTPSAADLKKKAQKAGGDAVAALG